VPTKAFPSLLPSTLSSLGGIDDDPPSPLPVLPTLAIELLLECGLKTKGAVPPVGPVPVTEPYPSGIRTLSGNLKGGLSLATLSMMLCPCTP